MKVIFILLLGVTACSAQLKKLDCESLNQGFFVTYENKIKIGYFLRKDNFQIEKAINDTLPSIAKFKSNNCKFYLTSFEVVKEIDTISWTVEYVKEKAFVFNYIMTPTYLDKKILFKGKTIKIDSLYDKDTFDLLNSWEVGVQNN